MIYQLVCFFPFKTIGITNIHFEHYVGNECLNVPVSFVIFEVYTPDYFRNSHFLLTQLTLTNQLTCKHTNDMCQMAVLNMHIVNPDNEQKPNLQLSGKSYVQGS